MSPRISITRLFEPQTPKRLGSLGGSKAYPTTRAFSILNHAVNQEPLNPVWPVTRTRLLPYNRSNILDHPMPLDAVRGITASFPSSPNRPRRSPVTPEFVKILHVPVGIHARPEALMAVDHEFASPRNVLQGAVFEITLIMILNPGRKQRIHRLSNHQSSEAFLKTRGPDDLLL